MGWAWLIILLATYPWLLGADLASDTLASSSLVVFVSGACLIAPCRRLKRWQCVLFAACLGFMFEARRPIPDGALALTLVGVAIFLSSNRPLLRSTPRMLQGAAIVNVGACLAWYLAASFASPSASDGVAGHLIGQLLLAGVVGTIGLVPVALTQNAAMDRLGVPPAPELP
jgi:4-amino-4-deoxy-L-arabinose transferase-like glycosyltransferase